MEDNKIINGFFEDNDISCKYVPCDNPLPDYEMFHRQQLAMTDMIVKSVQNCHLDKGGSNDIQ